MINEQWREKWNNDDNSDVNEEEMKSMDKYLMKIINNEEMKVMKIMKKSRRRKKMKSNSNERI